MINHKIFDSAEQVVLSLADDMQAYSKQDRPVHISLSGGSTPKMLFKRLAEPPYATSINWQNLHFWWGDERCVPPQDSDSNYGEAKALLFSHIDIPAGNIHRIRGEKPPEAEAKRFAQEMSEQIESQHGTPVFDWILLGVGEDGHTASLFPNQTDYQDQKLATVATHPQTEQQRISKTAKVLSAAKRISYLVLGAGKAEIVYQIHTISADKLPYPAAKIASAKGETEWYLDSDAAAKIA